LTRTRIGKLRDKYGSIEVFSLSLPQYAWIPPYFEDACSPARKHSSWLIRLCLLAQHLRDPDRLLKARRLPYQSSATRLPFQRGRAYRDVEPIQNLLRL